MRGRVRMLLVAAFGVLALTGCELKDDGDNLVNGKTLFVEKCAACHALARAGRARASSGRTSTRPGSRPNTDGFGRSTYEGVVHRQILQPNRRQQVDPATGKPLPLMPAKLVTGEDAQDVAAYVAYAADARRRGHAAGSPTAGAAEQEELAKAEGGKLAIPADPSGRTLYTFENAEAPAGALDDRLEERVDGRPQHRPRGQRRQRGGRRRQGRRHVDDPGRPQARRVHVLLLRARPPRGRHGGQAHRQVVRWRRGRAPPPRRGRAGAPPARRRTRARRP